MDLFEYIMKYLKDNFDLEDSDNFVKNTFSNFIDYAVKNFNNSEDQLAYYLSDMIDGLEFEKLSKKHIDPFITLNGLNGKKGFSTLNAIFLAFFFTLFLAFSFKFIVIT